MTEAQQIARMEYVLWLAKNAPDGEKEDQYFGTLAGMMELFQERFGYRPVLVARLLPVAQS